MTMEDAVKQSEDSVKVVKTGEQIENFLWKVFTAAVILCLIVSRFIHPVFASGISMEPTIEDGTFLLCNRTVKEFQHDDIVFISLDGGLFSHRIIKRVVGVPGDTIDIHDGILYVNGEAENRDFERMEDAGILSYPIVLQDDEFFVLGDNRNHSGDSREYGIISKKQITGRLSSTGIQTKFQLFK